MLNRRAAHDYFRHVADIDRTPIARGDKQKPDVGDTRQRLAGRDRQRGPSLAHAAREEGSVGAAHFGDELLERDAEQSELLRIGLDPDLFCGAAGNIAQADIVDLYEFGAYPVGKLVKVLIGPARGRGRLRRQSQRR